MIILTRSGVGAARPLINERIDISRVHDFIRLKDCVCTLPLGSASKPETNLRHHRQQRNCCYRKSAPLDGDSVRSWSAHIFLSMLENSTSPFKLVNTNIPCHEISYSRRLKRY